MTDRSAATSRSTSQGALEDPSFTPPVPSPADALDAAQAELNALAAGINDRSLDGDQRYDLLQDIQSAAGRLDELKRGPQ
ncbi:hypothetical protein [Kitasatospora kifunensis]|uniref:Uncharacterized protein n=1 Tax=Kitasatospora kifunensis TaxID=58351 RepID=A0A7W7QYN0_KITKI|nr:hypothetical protein [Kitasatospora kifunensis]MBB4922233.1 hypothetical protein [Kitasatospora kifunensis]